jgi:Tn7-like transposition protein D
MRHASKAGLSFPRPGTRISGRNGPPKVAIASNRASNRVSKSVAPDVMKRRAEWLALRSAFPAKSISELRHQATPCYLVLYRYDRKWLRVHTPIRRRPGRAGYRADWKRRDQELSQKMNEAKKDILRQPGSPKRISMTSLERQLGVQSFLQNHLSKLPLTRALLPSIVESPLDFALRRIAWAALQMRNEACAIKKWSLIARSGVGREMRGNPVIADAIRAELVSPGALKPDVLRQPEPIS